MKIRQVVSCALFGLLMAAAPVAKAQNWASGVDGVWHDAARWSFLPGSGTSPNVVVAGNYTVTVNDVTANNHPGTINNLLDFNRLGSGSAADSMTVLIDYSNPAVVFSARLWHIGYNGPAQATFRIVNGTVEKTSTMQTYNKGRIEALGGTLLGVGNLLVTNTDNAVGLLIDGGSVTAPVVTASSATGAQIELRSGSLDATTRVNVGGAGAGNRGTFTMSGGTLNSPTVGIGWGLGTLANPNRGYATITGGTVNATTVLRLAEEAWSTGELYVGGDAVINAASLIQGRTGEAMGSRLEIAGGTVNVAGTLGHVSLLTGFRHVTIVSGGTVNTLNLDLHRGDGTFSGGLTRVSNTINFSGPGSTLGDAQGLFDISGDAILEWTPGAASTMTVGVSTTDYATTTLRAGGTLRFVGANANNPNIIRNTGSTFTAMDATVEFKDVTAANLTGNIAARITYAGENTLRLNNASNVAVAGYTFGASPTRAFMNLDLLGGAVFQGNGTTLDGGSMLAVEVGGRNLGEHGRIAEAGTLTLGDSALHVTLGNGFIPLDNDAITIANAGTAVAGVFGGPVTVPARSIPAGISLADYQADYGVALAGLTATVNPTTVVLGDFDLYPLIDIQVVNAGGGLYQLDASGSRDPDDNAEQPDMGFGWDLTGNGLYTDFTGSALTVGAGYHEFGIRVTDNEGTFTTLVGLNYTIPEPGTLALLLAAVAGLAGRRRPGGRRPR